MSPTFLFENCSKTDVHFNHDHEFPEIAHLEKWNDLAKKFFRQHQEDLRPSFYRVWAGTDGRFQREIKKLEQNFNRKCSNKNSLPRRIKNEKEIIDSDEKISKEKNSNEKNGVRERRSRGQLRVAHNPGHRMRHIVRNIEKWTEEYLTGCSNQKKVINRWQKFVKRWEEEIALNPIFQKEFEDEENYLRSNAGPGGPCGRIYREFGLHGDFMELRDASLDENLGYRDLGRTNFGDNHIMSMVPFEG